MSLDAAPYDTDVLRTDPDPWRERVIRWIMLAFMAYFGLELLRDVRALVAAGVLPRTAKELSEPVRDVWMINVCLATLATPRWKGAAMGSMAAMYGVVFWFGLV